MVVQIHMDGGRIYIHYLQAVSFIEPVATIMCWFTQPDKWIIDNSQQPTIVDSSTNTQIFNETNVRKPSVDSNVYGEFSDRVI